MSTQDNPLSTPVDGPPYRMGPPDPGHLLPDSDWKEVVEHAEKIQREMHTGNSETSERPNHAGVIETSGVIVNESVGPIGKSDE